MRRLGLALLLLIAGFAAHAQIVPPVWTALGFFGNVAAPPAQQVKWNPGHYMLSDNEDGSPTSAGGTGSNHAEIVALAASGANVLGYEATYYWGVGQSGASTIGLDQGPLTFTTSLTGATSATLSAALANWVYTVRFSDGSYRQVTVGTGAGGSTSTAATWSGAVTASNTAHFYLFNMLQADYADLQATAPGKRFAVMIWGEKFNGTGATGLGIPNYILNNATYGAGLDGTHYGYWGLDFGSGQQGATAAVWRPAVAAQVDLLFDALANTPIGDGSGNTFDTAPLVEAIFFQESSLSLSAGSDFSPSAMVTQWEAMHTAFVASFPHTSIAPQINDVTTSQTSTPLLVANASINRQAMSTPDIIYPWLSASQTSDGQFAYTGFTWNGSAWVAGGTDYRPAMTYFAQVECDWDCPHSITGGSTSILDLFTIASTDLHASHIFWEHTSTDPSYADWVTKILPMINANPIIYTGYPANYPNAPLSLSGSPAAPSIGSLYSAALTPSGGASGYACSQVSATPNTALWLSITPSCTLQGVPENAETESVTAQVTDAAGATATETFTIAPATSGALTVNTSTTLPVNATSGGYYAYPIAIQGGEPPYSCSWPQSQPWQVTPDCWIEGTPTSTGSFTFTSITVTDSAGNTATYSPTLTIDSTLRLSVDYATNQINCPAAQKGSWWQCQIVGYGGSGALSYSVTAGLPSWASISNGLISGTPTASGNVAMTVKVADTASHTFSAIARVNVASSGQVSRPSYNSVVANGFFVLNGKLYDPNGYPFQIAGLDRNHYDSTSWASGASGALAQPNAVRIFMYTLNTAPTTPDAASYEGVIASQHIANGELPILTAAYAPNGDALSGNTSTTDLSNTVAWFVANESTFVPVMNEMAINIANEWGSTGTNSEATWQSSYESAVSSLRTAGYTCPIVIDVMNDAEDMTPLSNGGAAAILAADPLQNVIFDFHLYNTTATLGNITGITHGTNAVITFNSLAATNPFAALTNFGNSVYVSGVAGMTQINGQTVPIGGSRFGGSSGAWTLITSLDTSSYGTYTSGGTVNDSAYYALRASTLASAMATGIPVIVGEYGPPGAPATSCSAAALNNQSVATSLFAASLMAYGLPWMEWAWDDNNGGGGTTSWDCWFGHTLAGPGTYTLNAPSDLTKAGMDVDLNPRTGLLSAGVPPTVFH